MLLCKISGFPRGANEGFALLACYAAYDGTSVRRLGTAHRPIFNDQAIREEGRERVPRRLSLLLHSLPHFLSSRFVFWRPSSLRLFSILHFSGLTLAPLFFFPTSYWQLYTHSTWSPSSLTALLPLFTLHVPKRLSFLLCSSFYPALFDVLPFMRLSTFFRCYSVVIPSSGRFFTWSDLTASLIFSENKSVPTHLPYNYTSTCFWHSSWLLNPWSWNR
jgi:hypothetical protein